MTREAAWLMLVASGAADVAWAYATKRSNGWSDPGWAIVSLLLLGLFIGLLTQALRVLPLGTAYAAWAGIGAIGALTVGIVLLGETMAPARMAFAALTLVGVVGLKLQG